MGNLYTHIIEKERPHLRADPNPDGERALMARFSDLLMKEFTLVGIPIVLGAVSALAKVERPIDAKDVKLSEQRCFSFSFIMSFLINYPFAFLQLPLK